MKNSKLIKIGILGLGVVGSELVSLIRKNAQRISRETGVELEIAKVYVRSMTKLRTIDTSDLLLTTNYNDIIEDTDISIVCECMGGNGFEITTHVIENCLKRKKHVIMSSKKALAKSARQLLNAAFENKVVLKYDATVGGGIPIAKVLENSFKGDEISRIYGIFNATSNFIYSRMCDDNLPFDVALKEAQIKGYAENDPSDDVDGFDSLYKLIILAMFGIKKVFVPDTLQQESFTKIDVKDMEYAKELGYRIKPLSALAIENEQYYYKVAPFLVPEKHIVAQASNNFNAIVLEGRNCGELGFYGQGAGAAPTASAMFDDLVGILSGYQLPDNFPFEVIDGNRVSDLPSRFYMRFAVKNKVGVLAKVSEILASNGVNIERIIQKVEYTDGIEIVLITDLQQQEQIHALIEEYKQQKIDITAMYPVI